MTKAFFELHEPGRARELRARLRSEREAVVAELQQEVLAFPHWDDVLRVLGVKP